MKVKLNNIFGEHCGLNADWSVMAWQVMIKRSKGLFIIDTELEENQYEVTERSYDEKDWGTDREFNTLFTGTAEQCALFALGKVYEDVVGYDITKDDHNITVDKILQLMREYDTEAEEKPFNQYQKNETFIRIIRTGKTRKGKRV